MLTCEYKWYSRLFIWFTTIDKNEFNIITIYLIIRVNLNEWSNR